MPSISTGMRTHIVTCLHADPRSAATKSAERVVQKNSGKHSVTLRTRVMLFSSSVLYRANASKREFLVRRFSGCLAIEASVPAHKVESKGPLSDSRERVADRAQDSGRSNKAPPFLYAIDAIASDSGSQAANRCS
jgi:hypothetical protein